MRHWKEFAQGLAVDHPALVQKTLIEVWDCHRVLVEYHCGIIHYGTERIAIAATFGMIQIEGMELHLCCMSRDAMVISGEIRLITFDPEGR